MISFAQAKKYVSKPPNKVSDTYDNGSTEDIIETILYADKQEAKNRFMRELAPLLRGETDYQTCENVFAFVRKGLKYVADPRGWEKVKSSRQSLYSQFCDCKSYSILIISILRELGISCKYRFVSWSNGRDVSHVYPIAILRGGNYEYPVAIDAIPDSCGFNCEIRYSSKKDYDMTKISYIDGVNAANDTNSIPTQSNINFFALTDGEAALALARDRLKLLAAVHPDSPYAKDWRDGMVWIDNALFRGLHKGNPALPWGLFKSSEAQNIISFIKKSQQRFTPAQGNILALAGRNSPIQGIRELGYVGEIKFEDCGQLCFIEQTAQGEDIFDQDCLAKCDERNKMAAEVMNLANKAAHHFLYQFMPASAFALMTEDAKYKKQQHVDTLAKVAELSEISHANVVALFETEIRRKNATNSLGALSPEGSIIELIKETKYTFKMVYEKNPTGTEGIGVLPAAFWIIMACVAALIGVAGLIQVIQGREPTAFDRLSGFTKVLLNGEGTVRYSSDKLDFKDTTNETCGAGYIKDGASGHCIPVINDTKQSSTGLILPILAGGAVLYGVSTMGKKDKKKHENA